MLPPEAQRSSREAPRAMWPSPSFSSAADGTDGARRKDQPPGGGALPHEMHQNSREAVRPAWPSSSSGSAADAAEGVWRKDVSGNASPVHIAGGSVKAATAMVPELPPPPREAVALPIHGDAQSASTASPWPGDKGMSACALGLLSEASYAAAMSLSALQVGGPSRGVPAGQGEAGGGQGSLGADGWGCVLESRSTGSASGATGPTILQGSSKAQSVAAAAAAASGAISHGSVSIVENDAADCTSCDRMGVMRSETSSSINQRAKIKPLDNTAATNSSAVLHGWIEGVEEQQEDGEEEGPEEGDDAFSSTSGSEADDYSDDFETYEEAASCRAASRTPSRAASTADRMRRIRMSKQQHATVEVQLMQQQQQQARVHSSPAQHGVMAAGSVDLQKVCL